jgi:hypothetical protein
MGVFVTFVSFVVHAFSLATLGAALTPRPPA